MIEKTIKIFTIIGSVLGTIAFFHSFTSDLSKANKEKWKSLSKVINPVDLNNLCIDISSLSINAQLLTKLRIFALAIQNNNIDLIGFKSIFKNKINQRLNNFLALYNKFVLYVSSPYWSVDFSPIIDEPSHYRFNKEHFYKDVNSNEQQKEASKAVSTHLENLEITADDMKKILVEIQHLSNKEAFEFLLPWKWFK